MKGFGGFLVLAAIASAILPMMDRQLVVLMWIDNWGTVVGWVIRALMLIVGAGLFFVGQSRGE